MSREFTKTKNASIEVLFVNPAQKYSGSNKWVPEAYTTVYDHIRLPWNICWKTFNHRVILSIIAAPFLSTGVIPSH